MTSSAWIALGFGILSFFLNSAVLFIGYGVLKGTVTALSDRVAAHDAEIGALADLKVSVAEVKTSLTFLLEQFKDLNASIRWMREPAPPEPIKGVTPPRRRS